MLTEKHAPDYRLMVKILNEAIEMVHEGQAGTPQFEWVTEHEQSSQSVIVRDIPNLGESSHSVEIRDIPIIEESSLGVEIPIMGDSSDSEWSVIINRQ